MTDSTNAMRSPAYVRRAADRLLEKRHERQKASVRLAKEFETLNAYLDLAPAVTVALEQLSEQLFKQLLKVVQEKLTIALQEVLDQPLRFRAEAGSRNRAITVEFAVERDGNEEDLIRGQGGSVANVLSVCLRMFALATLDESQHRRFLVLDEQDCWLKPDLVPRLVKIVHDAGQALGFQVLMISHHDVAIFEQYADRIFQLAPQPDGTIEVRQLASPPTAPD